MISVRLLAGATTVGACLAAVAWLAGPSQPEPGSAGMTAMTAVEAGAAVGPALTATAELAFSDAPDGSIRVTFPRSGAEVAAFAPGSNGFARGLLRGLNRERRRHGISVREPYLLGRNTEDRLTLLDPTLGTEIVFDAFGSTNRDVFEALHARSIAALETAPYLVRTSLR